MAFRIVPPNKPTSNATSTIRSARTAVANADQEAFTSNGLANNNEVIAGVIDDMVAVPPLVLLTNPNTWDVARQKITNEGVMTRSRNYKVEHHGDAIDEITASGEVSAFISADQNGLGGLTRVDRNHTSSWVNLMSLYAIYSNNGVVNIDEAVPCMYGTETASIPVSVGNIDMYYDGVIHRGRFAEFSITEVVEKPFGAEYSFKFMVHKRLGSDAGWAVHTIRRATSLAGQSVDAIAGHAQRTLSWAGGHIAAGMAGIDVDVG